MKKLLMLAAILSTGNLCHSAAVIVKDPDGKTYRKEEINPAVRESEIKEYLQEKAKYIQYIQDLLQAALDDVAEKQKELADIQQAK